MEETREETIVAVKRYIIYRPQSGHKKQSHSSTCCTYAVQHGSPAVHVVHNSSPAVRRKHACSTINERVIVAGGITALFPRWIQESLYPPAILLLVLSATIQMLPLPCPHALMSLPSPSHHHRSGMTAVSSSTQSRQGQTPSLSASASGGNKIASE